MGRPKKDSSASAEVIDTDILNSDMYWIDKQPGWHYHCGEDSPTRIRQMQLWGYEVCTEEEVGGTLNVVKSPDNRVASPVGMIWMRCPEEVHNKREAAKKERYSQQQRDLEDTINDFKRIASKYRGNRETRAFAKLLSDKVEDSELEI